MSKSIKTQFCFPRVSSRVSIENKKNLVYLLMEHLKKNGSIEYAGYLKDKDLYKDILFRIGDGDVIGYKPLNVTQKKKVETTIHFIIQKLCREFSFSIGPIFIFIFPWFPSEEESVLLGGVNAVAPYINTLHLFIDPFRFTPASLRETIAHEFNHLVFYRQNGFKRYTLFENMIIEGLAENFREELCGGAPAPWSVAFSRKDVKGLFSSLKPFLFSKNSRLYSNVFFGSKKYKKWTGYSMGYWFVKSFIKRHPELSWQKVMEIKIEDIVNDLYKNEA